MRKPISMLNEGFTSFDLPSQEQLEALTVMMESVDKRTFIQSIDMKEGIVIVGYTYNMGTDEEFDRELIEVRVGGDSKCAFLNDVYTNTYKRCI